MKMDPRASVFSVLFVLAIGLSACSRPDDTPPPTPPADQTASGNPPANAEGPETDGSEEPATDTVTSTDDSKPAVAQTLRGILTIGFERSVIQLDGSSSLYWAKGPLNTIKIEEPSRIQDHKFRVEIEGTVSKRGQYGHMGAYEREVRIKKIVSSRPVP